MLDRISKGFVSLGMAKKVRLPADPNKKAKAILDILTSEDTNKANDGKNPAAVALGRLGGLKGGKARAKSLTAKKRSEIAKNAAKARWNKL
jgi:hypothetical protein